MTSEQWHKDKVVAYIIIGLIAVLGVALYVYIQLIGMSQQPAVLPQVHSLGSSAVLSPGQSAVKAAAINTVTIQKPNTLTRKQSMTKAAVIQAFEMENGSK